MMHRMADRPRLIAMLAFAAVLAGCSATVPAKENDRPAQARPRATAPSGTAAASTAAPPLRVRGNRLIDGRGRKIRLLGVNKSGTEGTCLKPPAPGLPPNRIF